MKLLNGIALIIILIGALNWGSWGLFQVDFIARLCSGNATGLARTIYTIIGLAGIWGVVIFCKKCKCVCSNTCCKCSKEK